MGPNSPFVVILSASKALLLTSSLLWGWVVSVFLGEETTVWAGEVTSGREWSWHQDLPECLSDV